MNRSDDVVNNVLKSVLGNIRLDEQMNNNSRHDVVKIGEQELKFVISDRIESLEKNPTPTFSSTPILSSLYNQTKISPPPTLENNTVDEQSH